MLHYLLIQGSLPPVADKAFLYQGIKLKNIEGTFRTRHMSVFCMAAGSTWQHF